MKDLIRLLCISDTHCGHWSGLTHPDYQFLKKWKPFQRQAYKKFLEIVENVDPTHLIITGDMIDGNKNPVECVTVDREMQMEMAVRIILDTGVAKGNIAMVHGTKYHIGSEDWESLIAKAVGAKIDDELFVDLNGVIFGLKHHIGTSSIPWGRYTAPARARHNNFLEAARDIQPKANIILRGHCHYYGYCGGEGWMAMTLPPLQWSTKFGRRIDNQINWGCIAFYIKPDGTYWWEEHLAVLPVTKKKAIKM